jgi:hypothetical protein
MGNLTYSTLVRGPICGLLICLPALPALFALPAFGFLEAVWFVSLMYVIGMLAGLISEGVLWAVWPVPNTVNKPKQGGIWDSELDGPA